MHDLGETPRLADDIWVPVASNTLVFWAIYGILNKMDRWFAVIGRMTRRKSDTLG